MPSTTLVKSSNRLVTSSTVPEQRRCVARYGAAAARVLGVVPVLRPRIAGDGPAVTERGAGVLLARVEEKIVPGVRAAAPVTFPRANRLMPGVELRSGYPS